MKYFNNLTEREKDMLTVSSIYMDDEYYEQLQNLCKEHIHYLIDNGLSFVRSSAVEEFESLYYAFLHTIKEGIMEMETKYSRMLNHCGSIFAITDDNERGYYGIYKTIERAKHELLFLLHVNGEVTEHDLDVINASSDIPLFEVRLHIDLQQLENEYRKMN